jgi:hypothetical protein
MTIKLIRLQVLMRQIRLNLDRGIGCLTTLHMIKAISALAGLVT